MTKEHNEAPASPAMTPWAGDRAGKIGHRLIGVVAVVVTVALVLMVAFYSERQRGNIYQHNEQEMLKVTESVSQSLQTVMLSGYADIARVFADSLKGVHGVVDFRILRVNGLEAFLDNATIHEVNDIRGDEDFLPRDSETEVRVLAADHRELQQTISNHAIRHYYDTGTAGEQFLTFLAPILNKEDCHKCHGDTQEVRGVLKLTTSLGPVQDDIHRTWVQSLVVLCVALTFIILVTAVLIRRSVVSPIITVSRAMTEVSQGNLLHLVPVPGRDEVGQMASSFNNMALELHRTWRSLSSEQDKLSTIIQTAREGMVVTGPDCQVVLVNPAAQVVLGKTSEQIITDGFLNLLDDPEAMLVWLMECEMGESHIVHYRDRILDVQAVTIHNAAGQMVGNTALIRDVTEEKQLEAQLRALSTTDGLTGLGNRRYLEQMLGHEIERARTQEIDVAVLMFDIDHFKKFNDTHGHDQGDRVLKAVAGAIRATVRKVDIPCRYGGEEFLVILPNTGREGAEILAERLRVCVETMRVDGLQVTISIGVATYGEHVPRTHDALIEIADAALYAAKKGGRNRVVVAEPAAPAAAELGS